mgnify:CR=1 FL=1
MRCEVFVPTVSSPAKQAKLRELGAQVVVTGAVYAEALEACLARQRETGALLTHAYDQPEVVAGAGTLAREIEEQGGGVHGPACEQVDHGVPSRAFRFSMAMMDSAVIQGGRSFVVGM